MLGSEDIFQNQGWELVVQKWTTSSLVSTDTSSHTQWGENHMSVAWQMEPQPTLLLLIITDNNRGQLLHGGVKE